MKRLVFIGILGLLSTHIYSQNGTVNIEQDPKIEELLKLYAEVNSKTEFYQIQVGFGSYQKAQNLKTQVEQDFPDLRSKIEFESPTYRVRLGNFRTKLDAERKLIEVRKKYPSAFLPKPKKKKE